MDMVLEGYTGGAVGFNPWQARVAAARVDLGVRWDGALSGEPCRAAGLGERSPGHSTAGAHFC